MLIHGHNFDATGNSVWFTRGAGTGDGTPVAVPGLISTQGGTLITCQIPINAGPGDLLVKLAGNTHADLSNAFPFDPALQHCPGVVSYGTPKQTSQFSLPQLYTQSWPSATLNDFKLGTYGGIPSAFGILFSGPSAQSRAFQGGTLLVGPPIKREQFFQFDSSGWIELPIAVDSAMAGTTRHYQIWFHDLGDAWGIGLSDAVQVGFCP